MRNILNILDGSKNRFPYLVESTEYTDFLVPNQYVLLDTSETAQKIGEHCVVLSKSLDTLYRSTNTWQVGRFSEETQNYGFPDNIHKREITVIVPDYTPSTYDSSIAYAVDVVTRIGLTQIVLASKIFYRRELLSLPKPFQEAGYSYHQYITFEILDPWDLCYSDEYRTFREQFCYETDYTNNCGALLDIEITPVEENSSLTGWIPSTQYSSGRNLILLSERDSDYLTLNLEETVDQGRTIYRSTLNFNSAFDGDLRTYFAETYFLDIDYMIPEIVVMDTDNIYKLVDLPEDRGLSTIVEFTTDGLRFDSWNDYVEGMFLVSTFRLFSTEGTEVMDIKSNPLPLYPEKFSALVGEELIIDDTHMEITNLDVVNKIEKKIISVNRPDEYKSNIVKPVFYRAFPAESIELHSTVSFNIGVDLDQYKTKIDSFSIQIEGLTFPEVGRVPGYVLFKIDGEQLPKTNPTGTYYILDGEGVLVTTGKYSFS